MKIVQPYLNEQFHEECQVSCQVFKMVFTDDFKKNINNYFQKLSFYDPRSHFSGSKRLIINSDEDLFKILKQEYLDTSSDLSPLKERLKKISFSNNEIENLGRSK